LVDDFEAINSLASLCVFVRRHGLAFSVMPEAAAAGPPNWDVGVTISLPSPKENCPTFALLRLVVQGWTIAEVQLNATVRTCWPSDFGREVLEPSSATRNRLGRSRGLEAPQKSHPNGGVFAREEEPWSSEP
ncbi:MAG: hypothetical protein H7Y19_08770, partial [Luteimonas sp.]|nr:hypothetical protein [Luteimonas sp.]